MVGKSSKSVIKPKKTVFLPRTKTSVTEGWKIFQIYHYFFFFLADHQWLQTINPRPHRLALIQHSCSYLMMHRQIIMTPTQHGPDYTLFEILFSMTLQNPFKLEQEERKILKQITRTENLLQPLHCNWDCTTVQTVNFGQYPLLTACTSLYICSYIFSLVCELLV